MREMNKYLLTFEAYSERKKKRIWDQLLKRKKRPFKSVNVEPETKVRNPDMTIPSSDVGG
jgi:predicted nucleic acid-binding OB-fold protein